MSCFSRQISPQYLVDFGEHGSLLNQPLIAPPSTDSHSIQTDEKELANPATVESRAPSPAKDKDADAEKHWVFARPGRCYHITLIVLVVLLVVSAAIALPLWLVPSGTGK